MFALLILAQIAIAAPTHPNTDSTYTTPALRELIARAAIANHAPPPALRGYRAHIETELSFLLRDTLGHEGASQIEQLGVSATWARSGEYELHVIGYRTQSSGAPFSALSFVKGWTAPTLYGERLVLGAEVRPNRATGNRGQDGIVAVHPFAADRDEYYRFSGGDTVTVMRTALRMIPIVRIHVTPHLRGTTPLAMFDGDIDLDATRHQIVRMRGQFAVVGPSDHRLPLWARVSGLVAVAYGEFVNAEVDGKYWLPAFQRTEFEANFAMFGPDRAVFRLLSRFSDYALDESGSASSAGDSMPRTRSRVTWAPSDSLSHFDDWRLAFGVATAGVTADDFADLAPDAWRGDGPPRLVFEPRKIEDVLRYNRVEGLYTGATATLEFRSLAPGLTANAFGGWAWTEATPRGGVRVTEQDLPWVYGLRAERTLASTNDFPSHFEDGGGNLGAFLSSVDDADYVDRRLAMGSVSRLFGSSDLSLATVQFGAGDDRDEVARLTRGLFRGATGFLPNRDAADGRYAIAMFDLDMNPNVSGAFVQPGVGGHLHYERATGELAWQRAELSVSAQRYWGPVVLSAHGDGGVVTGATIPPQQLFEIGGNGTLPGYSYKEFAGDRAALFQSAAGYTLPLWHAPHRVWRDYFVPGFAPGFAVSAQGGWTQISSDAAQNAVNALGAGWSPVPVSRATGGVRATVGLGLTAFSGALHLGLARPVDHPAHWGLVAGFGQGF